MTLFVESDSSSSEDEDEDESRPANKASIPGVAVTRLGRQKLDKVRPVFLGS